MVNKKTGALYWVEVAWFSTLQAALTYLVDLEVAETKLSDLRTVVKKQAELYSLIATGLTTVAVEPVLTTKPKRHTGEGVTAVVAHQAEQTTVSASG